MSMMLRRAMMVPSGGLPSAYQQVAYLQSTTYKPYINTGITPNDDMRVWVSGETETNVSLAEFVFGSRKGASQQRFWLVTYQGYYKIGYGLSANTNVVAANNSESFVADFNYDSSHSMTVNGTTITATASSSATTYEYPMYLFGCNDTGVLNGQYQPMKISGFKVYSSYQDANPIMDLVPCYRKADNKPGMYDTVSGTFYTNAGRGEFVIPT